MNELDTTDLNTFLTNLASALHDSGDHDEATKLTATASTLQRGFSTPLHVPHAATAVVRLEQIASAAQAATGVLKGIIGQP
ncbi:hypothetical protein [Nocardia brasiliensis]|uniref:hypothetical protein n=1 Tax=Nocardia brasiliensis TaxID=37326 RepID=UPI003D947A70